MKNFFRQFLKPNVDRLIESFITGDRAQLDASIEVLAKSAEPEVFPKLVDALKHPADNMRAGAARALARRRDKVAFAELVWLLPHGKHDIKPSTPDLIESLGNLADTGRELDRKYAIERLSVLLFEQM